MPTPDDDVRKLRFVGTPLDDRSQMEAAAELWRVMGIAAATWSRLEIHIDAVLIYLNQPQHSEKLADPEHPIGFKRKIKLLKRWFNQHPALAQYSGDMRSVTTDLLELSKTRNAFLHSILDSYDPTTKTVVFRSIKALGPTTMKLVKHVGTLATLLNFSAETDSAFRRFAKISTRLFAPGATELLRKP